MRPGTFVLPGNVSSQYISGLLLAAPLLAQPSCVQVTGLIESRPYINLTIQAMKAFGVEVNVERIPAKDGQPEVTNFRVSSGSYRTPGNVAVEGDWSNAAFWLCAGAIGCDPITVEGVSLSSAQGDRNVLAALSRFGARIVRSTNAATVQSDKLAGFEMSAHAFPTWYPLSRPWPRWLRAARSSVTVRACASRNLTVWSPPPASSPRWAHRCALPAMTSSSRVSMPLSAVRSIRTTTTASP